MFHFQKPVDGWPEAAVKLPAGFVIKAIDNVQMLSEAKAVNPGLVTIPRHHYTAQSPALVPETAETLGAFQVEADLAWKRKMLGADGGDTGQLKWLQEPASMIEDNIPRARDFFDSFIDGMFMNGSTHGVPYTRVDYVEEWNEYFADSQSPEERQRFINWAIAAAKVWKEEYRTRPNMGHIKLIPCNTAIGNDIPLQVAQAAQQYDALLRYHADWPVKDNEVLPGEWAYYSGRWSAMDAQFRSIGISVQLAFT